jgi:hypothetical protein
MTKDELEAEGFKFGARWPEDWREKDVRASFSRELPDVPAVYAILEDDQLVYIGKAERQRLKIRLRKYVNSNPNGTHETAKRVQGKVDAAAATGKKVSVYYKTIAMWEDEYIRNWQPPWNRHGIRDHSNDDDME